MISYRKLSHRNFSVTFLGLVDKGLKSLELHLEASLICPQIKSALWKVGGLTALTHLELASISGLYASQLQKVGTLPQLRSLALLHCQQTPYHLLKTGKFSSLQALHIEDDFPTSNEAAKIEGINGERNEKKLIELGNIVLDLPSLQQVSGSSAFFKLGMQAHSGYLESRSAGDRTDQ